MFRVKTENGTVIIVSETGQVSHAEVVETLTSLLDNASSYENKNLIIIDLSSNYSPSQVELQQFIYLIKQLLEKVFSRIALVVPKNFHYGLGRMTEAFTESAKGQFRVFKRELDAREWISF